MAFFEQGEIDAEAGVGGFCAGDGLKEEVKRNVGCALLDGGHLRCDVGEDAVLRGDAEALADSVYHAQQAGDGGGVVADWIDADDGVSGAEQQAVEERCGDAGGVVGGVVGLEAGGEPAGESDGGAKAGYDADLGGDEDEVLDAHELADGGGHLWC